MEVRLVVLDNQRIIQDTLNLVSFNKYILFFLVALWVNIIMQLIFILSFKQFISLKLNVLLLYP